MIDLDLVYAAYQAAEERTRQQNIVLMRDYYEGEHNAKMGKRQEEYIANNMPNPRFSVNYCAPVVDAVVERMIVTGFQSGDEAYAAWCWDVWKHNKMDAKQRDTHQQAINEAESFVFVDWPEGDRFPTYTPHPRYTDREVGGTGYGCKAHYAQDDPNQELEAISKRWYETYQDEGGKNKVRERMNIYYPDRIERWVARAWSRQHNAGWEPFADEEGEAIIPEDGIPVAHIRKTGTYELWDAIVPQDIINKMALDAIAIGDACGFPIRMAYGWVATTDGRPPEDDGGNYMVLTPGSWISVSGKEARTEVIPPADLLQVMTTIDSWIMKLAQVTGTPSARFQITGLIAAEGTLKQQEGPLLAKVRAHKTLIGNGWENLCDIARRLGAEHGVAYGEDMKVETQWGPSETRDEPTIDEKVKAGVPRETLWEDMGYDKDRIAAMKAQSAEELASTSNLGGALLQQFERGV